MVEKEKRRCPPEGAPFVGPPSPTKQKVCRSTSDGPVPARFAAGALRLSGDWQMAEWAGLAQPREDGEWRSGDGLASG